MTQRINFYTAEFRARRDYLTLPHLALACAVVLLIGVLVALAQWRSGVSLQREVTALQVDVDKLKQALEADRARLARHAAASTLTRDLQRLQDEVASKTQLVSALQNTPLLVRNGYAPIFEALAKHPLDGLWLTRIDIVGDAINLAGTAQRPELVPEYIAALMGDAQFDTQSYETLTMKRDEQGLMQFEIRQRAQEAGRP